MTSDSKTTSTSILGGFLLILWGATGSVLTVTALIASWKLLGFVWNL